MRPVAAARRTNFPEARSRFHIGACATGRILMAQNGPKFSEYWTGQRRAGLCAHRYVDLHFPEIFGIMEICDHLHKLVAN
jgi:hypothetical protein